MARESPRDIIIRKGPILKAIKGVDYRAPAEPFRHVADDGTKHTNLAEAMAHNKGIHARDAGNRTYEVTENRFFRRA